MKCLHMKLLSQPGVQNWARATGRDGEVYSNYQKKKQSSFLNLTSRTGWDIVPSVSSHSVIVSTVKAKQLVQQSTCCGAGLKMLTETKPYQHCLWGGPVWTQSSGKSRWSSGRTSDWPGPTACTAHHCFLFPVSQHEKKIKSLNVQGSFN